MSVFDGAVKIGRAVRDPGTDKKLPPVGSLSYGAIKSVTALSGTTGVDACLIQGNKWQELKGQHTENVLQHHLLTIQGNRQEMVVGNHTHTIVGNTNTTQIGTHNQTNIAARNDTCVQPYTENHSQPDYKNQPTQTMGSASTEHQDKEEAKHFHGFEWNVIGTSVEVTGVKAEHKSVALDVTNVKADFEMMHAESKSFHQNLSALASDIHGGKLKAAATHAKAIGANICAGIAANLDSPFA
jgi:hypothetical protein